MTSPNPMEKLTNSTSIYVSNPKYWVIILLKRLISEDKTIVIISKKPKMRIIPSELALSNKNLTKAFWEQLLHPRANSTNAAAERRA